MADIQRWAFDMEGTPRSFRDGPYVTYADHVDEVRKAEERGRGYGVVEGFTRGQRDAIAGAVQRVSGLLIGFEGYRVDTIIAAIKGDA